MSVALDLLPVDCWSETNGKVWGYSHTIIPVRRGSDLEDGDLYADIEKLKPTKLPKGHNFTSYVSDVNNQGNYEYGVLKTTPYGKPYTWVTAKALARVLKKHHPKDPSTAFVAALRTTVRIILHWH